MPGAVSACLQPIYKILSPISVVTEMISSCIRRIGKANHGANFLEKPASRSITFVKSACSRARGKIDADLFNTRGSQDCGRKITLFMEQSDHPDKNHPVARPQAAFMVYWTSNKHMRKATIHVVDDDQAVRESIKWLIESVDMNIKTYGSANEFLDKYTEDSLGCLILDVRMPGISGLELQSILTERSIDLPIVFITGHGDVPMAVRALKNGAVDFIEKPFNDQTLLDTIQTALRKHRSRLKRRGKLENIQYRYDNLTSRERQVMDIVVAGKPNRDAADALGISVKTVEVHRAKMMEKMKAKSVADLVKMVIIMREANYGKKKSRR